MENKNKQTLGQKVGSFLGALSLTVICLCILALLVALTIKGITRLF